MELCRIRHTYVHLGMFYVRIYLHIICVYVGTSRHRRLRNTSSKQFVVGHERRYHVLVRRRSVALRPPPAVATAPRCGNNRSSRFHSEAFRLILYIFITILVIKLLLNIFNSHCGNLVVPAIPIQILTLLLFTFSNYLIFAIT